MKDEKVLQLKTEPVLIDIIRKRTTHFFGHFINNDENGRKEKKTSEKKDFLALNF